MFSLFIVLLSFSESLATKYLFLNDEQCMVRPTFIDMNPVELKYYPIMISLKINSSYFGIVYEFTVWQGSLAVIRELFTIYSLFFISQIFFTNLL